jgi:uncharacterized membrane protein
MSYARRLAPLAAALVAAAALAPIAASDPDIDTESAAAVIDELKEQGYRVEIKGVSNDDTSLLTGCTVTSIRNPGNPTTDPTTTTTVYVEVACPLHHS